MVEVLLPLISQLITTFLLMIKKVKEMIKIIEDDGWELKAHNGTSHRQYKHSSKTGKVTINGKLSDDLDHFLVNSILKQAGLK